MLAKHKAASVAICIGAALTLLYAYTRSDSYRPQVQHIASAGRTPSYEDPAVYIHHLYNTPQHKAGRQIAAHCNPDEWEASFWRGQRVGDQLFGTEAAQQSIWSHQNPLDCANKKFLVYASDEPFVTYGHGIGSTLHVATWALAKAMETDRVLVFAPTPEGIWTQGNFCIGHDNLHDCYFEAASTCSYFDATDGQSLEDIAVLDDNARQQHLKVIRSDIRSPIADVGLVPAALKATLLQSPIPPDKLYFWFRAQAIAYLIRPTSRTLLEIDTRKAKQAWVGVPDGSISIHIRHGDKGIEMELEPDVEYAQKAEELVAAYPKLKRVIFLSTEDPKSVEYFKQLGNWTILTLHVPRPDLDMVIGPTAYAQQIGPDEEMLNSLVNLDLALTCSAWVGTIASNWNRLIEELRSTVRCKAHMPYIDAHYGWEVHDYFW